MPLFRLYKLMPSQRGPPEPQPGSGNTFMCWIFQFVEPVIKQHKESCMGFFQSQTSKYAKFIQDWANSPRLFASYGRRQMPECMKVYLPKETEEEDTEFPTFSKLIQELVMIQKLLSKKP